MLPVSSETALPDSADVVVIGGGIVGCSILYHLAARGVTDALLLERNELTSGATAKLPFAMCPTLALRAASGDVIRRATAPMMATIASSARE